MIFADDLQVNVDAARRLGMHAVHSTGPDQLIGAVTAQVQS